MASRRSTRKGAKRTKENDELPNSPQPPQPSLPPPSPVFQIPELLLRIFQFSLDQTDHFSNLCRYALVSSALRPPAYSLLYSNVQVQFRCTKASALLRSLERNQTLGNLVSSFAVEGYDSNRTRQEATTQFWASNAETRLELMGLTEEEYEEDPNEQTAHHQNGIRELINSHSESGWRLKPETYPREVLRSILKSFPNLTHLSVRNFVNGGSDLLVTDKLSVLPIFAGLTSLYFNNAPPSAVHAILAASSTITELRYHLDSRDVTWIIPVQSKRINLNQLKRFRLSFPPYWSQGNRLSEPATTFFREIIQGASASLLSLGIYDTPSTISWFPPHTGQFVQILSGLRMPALRHLSLVNQDWPYDPADVTSSEIFFQSLKNLKSFATGDKVVAERIKASKPQSNQIQMDFRKFNDDEFGDEDVWDSLVSSSL